MFAALTGLIQLTNQNWSKYLGTIVNLKFDVNNQDFSNLWKLYLISTICAALPLLFVWVAPTNDLIRKTQKVVKFMDEYEDAQHCQENVSKDKDELFKSLKQKEKPADSKKVTEGDDQKKPAEEVYEFHKEINNIDPLIARQCGIFARIKKDYGIELDPVELAKIQPNLAPAAINPDGVGVGTPVL